MDVPIEEFNGRQVAAAVRRSNQVRENVSGDQEGFFEAYGLPPRLKEILQELNFDEAVVGQVSIGIVIAVEMTVYGDFTDPGQQAERLEELRLQFADA